MKKYSLFFIFILLLFGAGFLAFFPKKETSTPPELPTVNLPAAEIEPASTQTVEPPKTELPTKNEVFKQEVPFVVQAPFGNWRDPNFQNACEEASVVMAMSWLNGEKNLSPTEAQRRILEIIDFENKTFGYSVDTDVFDLQQIFSQHFKKPNTTIKENPTVADIVAELQQGKVVLVPAFGQALKNPNFTQPGPVAHMLVLTGYDPTTQEFITNDPGTKKGASYRYPQEVLWGAIWSYASGKDVPPSPKPAKMKKVILSVSK